MKNLSQHLTAIQDCLFPAMEKECGKLSEKQMELIRVLEISPMEKLSFSQAVTGRPPEDRIAIARAFIAKAVYNMPTTDYLVERLTSDRVLRQICGWLRSCDVPSKSTFSRAFSEFSEMVLPGKLHEMIIDAYCSDHLFGHISRDSTAIIAREKPVRTKTEDMEPENRQKKKRGRPKKGEERPKPETRLDRQLKQTLPEMLAEIPRFCNVGSKKNSNGYKETWIGYKLHIDSVDGGIPVNCMLTSASLHDSQVAIPMARITSKRITALYELMDSAYDSWQIRKTTESLGMIPIIDPNRRNGKPVRELDPAKKIRYRKRSSVERVNSRLKDDFGGRHVRVKGHLKVFSHLMFGIVALTACSLIGFVT